MLYLNISTAEIYSFLFIYLTLTSVVFELMYHNGDYLDDCYLTLTSVVFEFISKILRYVNNDNLTLTSVVFELLRELTI